MLVHNKGDYVRNQDGVRLIPGVNNISEAQWKKFIAHPLNQKLVDEGEIIPQIAEDGGDYTGKAKTLADLTVPEASSLIKDTHDLGLLAELLKEEEAGKNRKAVIDSISKQADQIEKEIEEAKKKAENGGNDPE